MRNELTADGDDVKQCELDDVMGAGDRYLSVQSDDSRYHMQFNTDSERVAPREALGRAN